MNSVFREIEKIRGGEPLNSVDLISNRYTVICQEADRTQTAYCFAVPIRNIKNNNIVDLNFSHSKLGSAFFGSEAKITVGDRVSLVNSHGRCDIVFQGRVSKKTKEAIYYNDQHMEIRPTLNGVLVIIDSNEFQSIQNLTLSMDRSFGSIRENGKCFCIMREEYIPFVIVSCVGVLNNRGQVIAPCEVYSRKISDMEYALTFSTTEKTRSRIAIEINMQETKLFQDTTVESKHPNMNNAYGGIAFLGKSESFGEQWLYSRLEISNVSQLQTKRIIKTILHIPRLGCDMTPISVHRISKRFCSFGSTWENKVAVSEEISESPVSDEYYHIDMTRLLGDLRNSSENFVIKGRSANKPAVIPTGDNFYAPQILEVKFQ